MLGRLRPSGNTAVLGAGVVVGQIDQARPFRGRAAAEQMPTAQVERVAGGITMFGDQTEALVALLQSLIQ
ncbi:MAG: hypothetical protein MUC36_00715 [Planctomycetes bacterium]|nr:hypothetical protein [Planctomycetota bacterium]